MSIVLFFTLNKRFHSACYWFYEEVVRFSQLLEGQYLSIMTWYMLINLYNYNSYNVL